MTRITKKLPFTGEYYVPNKTPERIANDHLARYELATNFVSNKLVLDAACGTGYGSEMLIQAGSKQVVGIDINRDVLRFAKSTYIHTNLNQIIPRSFASGFNKESLKTFGFH